jgi:ketosteroid isomerase-like protein
MKTKFLSLLVLGAMLSCQPAEQTETVDVQAEAEMLMNLSREWNKAAEAKDLDAIVSYWSDDAITFSPNEEPVKGKDALRAMVAESLTMEGFSISWEPQSAHVSASGDLGYLLEKSKITYPDSLGNTVTIYNNTVTIWKKDADGNWKAVVDISANLPQN